MNSIMIKLANLAANGGEMEKTALLRATKKSRQRNRAAALGAYDDAVKGDSARSAAERVADSYKGDGIIDKVMRAESGYHKSISSRQALEKMIEARRLSDKSLNPWKSYLPGGSGRQARALEEMVLGRGDKSVINPSYHEYRKPKSLKYISSVGDKLRSDSRSRLYEARDLFVHSFSDKEQDVFDKKHFRGLQRLYGREYMDKAMERGKQMKDAYGDSTPSTATYLANLMAHDGVE